MDKAAQRYLTRLRHALVCPKEDRERLLEDAGAMLENFAQENPRAFYKDYVASFGSPEDFADEMLSNVDPEDIAEVRKKRKYIRLGLLVAAIAVLILTSIFWFNKWKIFHDIIGDNDWQVIEPAKQLTDEEAQELLQQMIEQNKNLIGD